MSRSAGLFVASVFVASALLSCSSKENPPVDAGSGCTPFTAPAAGGTATKAQVTAILQTSCAFNSCHGASPGQGKLFLPASGDWRAEVVDKPSTQHKTMKRVVPGDPQNSWFLLKLTDGLCAVPKSSCNGDNCGVRMPQANDALPKEDIQTISDWIRAGAPDT